MDSQLAKNHKREHQQRNNDFTYFEKSSSEPDLSDYTPTWRHVPYECITVDDLKFFRRRKISGRFADFYTKSNFALYDLSKPIVPFSELKTEYEDEYGHLELIPRSALRRRSTSLKLDGLMEVTNTEQQSMYRPYLENETESSRQSMIKYPDNLSAQFACTSVPDFVEEMPSTTIKNMEQKLVKSEAQQCHLKLEGELSYIPEYRSQFIPFPIERSHSIPQLSNIKFHGKFGGIPEYTASYKSYDNIAKREMIKNPDLINIKGLVDGTAEYNDNFKQPDKEKIVKSISAKGIDGFHLQQDYSKHIAEYNDRYKDPKIMVKPERPKPRSPILSLKGIMDYNPEYRSTYVNFPRSRPITRKPSVNLNIFDPSFRKIPSPTKKVDTTSMPKSFHHSSIDEPLNDLPFMCQPEVRRAKQDLLIKERSPTREQPIHQDLDIIEQRVVGLPSDETTNKTASRTSLKSRQGSPAFKLTVQNVDDSGGTFRKHAPKYGRRASHLGSEAHRLRNRTRVIEGNPKYFDAKDMNNHKNRLKDHSPSFIVLNEPCKQSKWMKPSWYDT